MNLSTTQIDTGKVSAALCASAALMLWIFLWVRVVNVDITHDEAVTFLAIEEHTCGEIITGEWTSANNHILSSILIKFNSHFFGTTVVSLRLVSLFCFPLFALFFYKIIRELRFSEFSVVASCFVCWINPYMLDYFSLARGYAPAITFMTMAIYLALRYVHTRALANLIWYGMASMLSVFSNFVLLQFVVTMSGLLLLNDLIQHGIRRRSFIALMITNVLILFLVYQPLHQIMSAGELYFGGKSGLFNDTVLSMAYSYLYSMFSWNYNGIAAVFLFSVPLLLALGIFFWPPLRRHFKDPARLLLFALFPCLLLVVELQHLLIGTNYLLARTTLFLQVTAIMALVVSLEVIRTNHRSISVVGFCIWLTLTGAHIRYSMNASYSIDNKDDVANREIYDLLMTTATTYQLNEIGTDPVHEPALRFYAKAEGNLIPIRKYEFNDSLMYSPIFCWTRAAPPFGNRDDFQPVNNHSDEGVFVFLSGKYYQ